MQAHVNQLEKVPLKARTTTQIDGKPNKLCERKWIEYDRNKCFGKLITNVNSS